MAKITLKGTGEITEIAAKLHQAVMNSGLSVELAEETRTEHGNMLVLLRVYEKFFYRASNRVSLCIQMIALDNEIVVHAIASGGGQGPIFKMDWGAESDFAYVVVGPLRKLDFVIESQS